MIGVRLCIGGLALVLSLGFFDGASAQDPWGYACENCPANNCAGPDQSPIAFSDSDVTSKRRAAPLRVRYGPTEFEPEVLTTNIEFKPVESNAVRFKGTTYEFQQFHFHTTAEHVIRGERSNLEVHFVNQAPDGSLLVIAVFIREGRMNEAYLPITDWFAELAATNDPNAPDHPDVNPLRALLPRKLASNRYVGSTTTPPCTGGVQWILLKQHVKLSADQIADIRGSSPTFSLLGLNDGFDNNRPVQNREGRKIIMPARRGGDNSSDNSSDDSSGGGKRRRR